SLALGHGFVFHSLQLFAGFEAHNFARGDADFFAGARIAADSSLSRTHAEHTESAEFDALAAAHGVFQRLAYGFHGLLAFDPTHSHAVFFELLQDGIHDIQLDHSSLRRTWADARGAHAGCQDVRAQLHCPSFSAQKLSSIVEEEVDVRQARPLDSPYGD